jgi:hypothetical protein
MLGRVSPRRTIWTICRESYCSPGVEQIIQVGQDGIPPIRAVRQPSEDPAEAQPSGYPIGSRMT